MRIWKFDGIDFSSFPYYGGDDLGVLYTKGKTNIRVWAPSALEVELRIYEKSTDGEPIRIDQFYKAENGTWTIALNGDLKGFYYTIKVNDGDWLNETPGVDARAVGVNGHRGLIFNPEETN